MTTTENEERSKALLALDSIPPRPDQDRGPVIRLGMTMEERLALGIEQIEPVSLGKGYDTVDVVRRKWAHVLDMYYDQGKLGDGEKAGYRRDVGMGLAEDFHKALAAARVTANYEGRSSGSNEGWSLMQIEARNRLNVIFRGIKNLDGTYAERPVLNSMGSRLALHVCCLGEGTQSFDQAMMAAPQPGWRRGHAMSRLVEVLDDLLAHHRRRFHRGG